MPVVYLHRARSHPHLGGKTPVRGLRLELGNGLWGLLEIAVFGAFFLVVLRAPAKPLVYFKANEAATDSVSRTRISSSLLEDVRDAIQDIADEAEATTTSSCRRPTPRPTSRSPAARPAPHRPPDPGLRDVVTGTGRR